MTQPPYVQTNGLTPASFDLTVITPEDSVGCYRLQVFAWNHGAAVSYWEYLVLQRRVGSDPAAGPAPVLVKHSFSPTGSAWTVGLSFASSGDLTVTYTGGLGQTVDWLQYADAEFGMAGPFG